MKLTVSQKKTTPISKDLIGVFFEDINYGADGGIYAELIENRNFEFVDCYGDKGDYYTIFDGGYGWKAYPTDDSARLQVVCGSPVSDENPHYLRFTANEAGAGFSNQAYSGITLKKGAAYNVSFYARAVSFLGEITAKVVKDGVTYAEGSVHMAEEDKMHYWHKYTLTVTASDDVNGALFVLALAEKGTAEFDFVSMIPADAVAGVFRKDTFEILQALKPAFMRFPGGCIVEGNTMSNRYRFKDTLKRIEDRKCNWNRWAVHNNRKENDFHSEFSHYNQTLGIGYYEFFLLCDLIGAKPLPVMNVGMACQYQSYEYMEIGSAEFEQMVQDTLDLIEFANGDESSKWGKVRAQLGHKAPFELEYLGIGNEQWQMDNTDFFARYKIFEQRIHAKYPEIKLIGSAGPDVTSNHYTDAWEFYRKEKKNNPNFVYAIDEHYYMPPQWFLEHNDFYDNYPRDIKVFAGEYAAHDPEINIAHVSKNNWKAGISEAAFLTGIERNADVVALSSYAPLFARVNYTQWAPDLIWMDENTSWGTPSYYVQKLFSKFHAESTLDLGDQIEKLRAQGIYCSAGETEDKTTIVKLVNTTDNEVSIDLENEEGKALTPVKETVMCAALTDYNCAKNPMCVAPKETVECSGKIKMAPQSFIIVEIK